MDLRNTGFPFYNEEGTPTLWSSDVEYAWKTMQPAIAAQRKRGETVVEVFEPIYRFTTPLQMFTRAMEKADGGTLRIDINSPGGDAFQGIAILNALDRYDGPVEVHALGLVASAAQMISLAGDTVYAYEGSQFMIHRAQGLLVAIGDYEETTRQSAAFNKASKDMTTGLRNRIATRMKITQNKAGELLAAETWYTAQEAVDAGLASSVRDRGTTEGGDRVSNDVSAKAGNPYMGGIDAAFLASMDARLGQVISGGYSDDR